MSERALAWSEAPIAAWCSCTKLRTWRRKIDIQGDNDNSVRHRREMRHPAWIFVRALMVFVALAISPIVAVASSSNAMKVIASIAEIRKREAPLSPGFEVEYVIHSPERLRATAFIVLVNSADRARVRAAHPIGLLESVELPASIVESLVEQRKAWESTERQIDDGVRREMISEAILLPSVDAKGLRFEPASVQISE